jgi:hypothetical protein
LRSPFERAHEDTHLARIVSDGARQFAQLDMTNYKAGARYDMQLIGDYSNTALIAYFGEPFDDYLEASPAYIDQITTKLRGQLARGIVYPRDEIVAVVRYLDGLLANPAAMFVPDSKRLSRIAAERASDFTARAGKTLDRAWRSVRRSTPACTSSVGRSTGRNDSSRATQSPDRNCVGVLRLPTLRIFPGWPRAIGAAAKNFAACAGRRKLPREANSMFAVITTRCCPPGSYRSLSWRHD